MVMRETLDGFQGGQQIGGRMITNLRYADDIILLETSEAELQEGIVTFIFYALYKYTYTYLSLLAYLVTYLLTYRSW